MPPVLRVVSLVVFASSLFARAVDPIIPRIAGDLGIAVSTAALLSTAFTFPYALMQPLLGIIGDLFGKTRLMNLSLAVVVVSTLVCAFASKFTLLVAMRILAGMLAGGIFPVGIAIIGEVVPLEQRQVAMGRLLGIGLTGNLISSTISGVIGDLLGWRGVFLTTGGFGLIAAITAFFAFRGLALSEPKRLNWPVIAAGYRGIIADPRAKVCFSSVFIQGIVIHGMFPFVALLLMMNGATRSSYAGIVIAAFGFGGVLFSLGLSFLVARITERHMLLTGAACASVAFVLIALNMPWYAMAPVFLLFGIGFYMLHNCIQVHVSDLGQTARATAMSLFYSSFFFGQAVGPIYYGYAFHHLGNRAPLFIGAGVIVAIGLICARYLRRRRTTDGLAELGQ